MDNRLLCAFARFSMITMTHYQPERYRTTVISTTGSVWMADWSSVVQKQCARENEIGNDFSVIKKNDLIGDLISIWFLVLSELPCYPPQGAVVLDYINIVEFLLTCGSWRTTAELRGSAHCQENDELCSKTNVNDSSLVSQLVNSLLSSSLLNWRSRHWDCGPTMVIDYS